MVQRVLVMVAVVGLIGAGLGCRAKIETSIGTPSSPEESAPAPAEAGPVETPATPGQPAVASVVVGDTRDQDSGAITNETTDFSPQTQTVYCKAMLTGLKTGAVIKGTLIAVAVMDTKGNMIHNHEVVSKELEAPGEDVTADFTFSAPTKGWPVGEYVIEISVDGQKLKEVELMCESEAGQN